jgi:hypothetical protein
MTDKLLKLFQDQEFDKLEEELKKIYPQIDGIEWEADHDGDIALHIVFVKMPYMLPFSGSSYAHFSDLITTENGMGLIDIMKECRVIEKEDVYEQYSSLEVENYAHDLENRGYDVDQFDDMYGDDYVNALWDIIQEIKEKEGLV